MKRTVIVIGGPRYGKTAAALRALEEAGAEVLVVEPLEIPGAEFAREMADFQERLLAEVAAAFQPPPPDLTEVDEGCRCGICPDPDDP